MPGIRDTLQDTLPAADSVRDTLSDTLRPPRGIPATRR
jgi:hypothetical protein